MLDLNNTLILLHKCRNFISELPIGRSVSRAVYSKSKNRKISGLFPIRTSLCSSIFIG